MNILIISGAFQPEISPRSFRTTELTKELCRQGHKITLYIPKYNYDYTDFLKSYPITIKIADIGEDHLVFSGFLGKVVARLKATYIEYPNIRYLKIIPELLKNEKDYDLLISIAMPHPIHWGIDRLIRKHPNLAKTWVADCGDPYMLENIDTFRHPFYFKPIEKSWCRRADYIAIPIESGKDGYYKEFHDKIRIISQGFNFDDFRSEEAFKPNEPITFGYSGVFIPGLRDPRPILAYLAQTDIDFKFIVYTRQKGLFSDYLDVLKGKLILMDYIPRNELLLKLSKMDFLLNLENGTTIHTPSKLIDYGLTKRPILSINSQDIDTIKFDNFLKRDYDQQYIIDNFEQYDIRNVANKFISLAK